MSHSASLLPRINKSSVLRSLYHDDDDDDDGGGDDDDDGDTIVGEDTTCSFLSIHGLVDCCEVKPPASSCRKRRIVFVVNIRIRILVRIKIKL